MIPDEELIAAMREARGDRQLAFVQLERRFRETLNKRLAILEQNQGYDAMNASYIEYVNHTIATAKACGIKHFDSWKLPSHSHDGSLIDTYRDFTSDVDNFSLQVRINYAEHQSIYSVYLTPADKTSIRHLAEEIKKIIESSQLPKEKRESLLKKLNAFITEVDRDRTRLETYADLMIGFSHAVGESANELKPVASLITKIGRVFGLRQEAESQVRLPPAETKQIEPARRVNDEFGQPGRNERSAADQMMKFHFEKVSAKLSGHPAHETLRLTIISKSYAHRPAIENGETRAKLGFSCDRNSRCTDCLSTVGYGASENSFGAF
jgi:hypothetical protein